MKFIRDVHNFVHAIPE